MFACLILQTGGVSVIHAAYEDLSRVAVYLDMALEYEKDRHHKYGDSLTSQFNEILNRHLIDNMLCQLRITVGLLGSKMSIEVSRNIAQVHRHMQTDAMVHMRDYLALKDFHKLLTVLDKVFSDILKQIQSNTIPLDNYIF